MQNIKSIICGFFQSIIFCSLGLLVIATVTRYYIENYFVFSLSSSFVSTIIFLFFANKINNKSLIRFSLINLISFIIFTILFFTLIRIIGISKFSSQNLNSGDSFLLSFTLVEYIVYSFLLECTTALILFVKNIRNNKKINQDDNTVTHE